MEEMILQWFKVSMKSQHFLKQVNVTYTNVKLLKQTFLFVHTGVVRDFIVFGIISEESYAMPIGIYNNNKKNCLTYFKRSF